MALTKSVMSVSRHEYFTYYKTDGGANTHSLSDSFAPAIPFELDEIRMHLSVVHTSVVDFVVQLSCALGSAYNILLLSQTMLGVKDLIFKPDKTIFFGYGDQLNLSMIMSSSNYYGLYVCGWAVTGGSV